MRVHEPDGDGDVVLVAFVKNGDRSYARENKNERGQKDLAFSFCFLSIGVFFLTNHETLSRHG